MTTNNKMTNEEMTEIALHECGGEATFRAVVTGYSGDRQQTNIREQIIGKITPKERADIEAFEENYEALFVPKTALAWLKEHAPTETYLDIPGLKDEEGVEYFIWANTHGVPHRESRIFKMLIVAHFYANILADREKFDREIETASSGE